MSEISRRLEDSSTQPATTSGAPREECAEDTNPIEKSLEPLMASASEEEMKCSVRDCPFHQGNCIEGISAPGIRRCPKCTREIEKETMGCNVMHCPCGAWFCYYCGGGPFKTEKKAIHHVRVQHQGAYADPPDYRRYVLHDSTVTDEEIAQFYEVYPQLRPIGYHQ